MEKFEDDYILSDETIRLRNLERYNIHHNRSEPIFDQLAAMTATILEMPIALINFVDEDKVWRNSFTGLEVPFNMDAALCAMVVDSESANLVNRLAGKPHLMVDPVMAAEFGLRFYAAVPITTVTGLNVGMICVADQSPRLFLPKEKAKLTCMASLVQKEMNQRIAGNFYA